MKWYVDKIANGNDYWFTKEVSQNFIIYQVLKDNHIKYALYRKGNDISHDETVGLYDTLQQSKDAADPILTQKIDKCRELIEQLSKEYGLSGLVLDLSNGWILRKSSGNMIVTGSDRVPEYLVDRGARILKNKSTR